MNDWNTLYNNINKIKCKPSRNNTKCSTKNIKSIINDTEAFLNSFRSKNKKIGYYSSVSKINTTNNYSSNYSTNFNSINEISKKTESNYKKSAHPLSLKKSTMFNQGASIKFYTTNEPKPFNTNMTSKNNNIFKNKFLNYSQNNSLKNSIGNIPNKVSETNINRISDKINKNLIFKTEINLHRNVPFVNNFIDKVPNKLKNFSNKNNIYINKEDYITNPLNTINSMSQVNQNMNNKMLNYIFKNKKKLSSGTSGFQKYYSQEKINKNINLNNQINKNYFKSINSLVNKIKNKSKISLLDHKTDSDIENTKNKDRILLDLIKSKNKLMKEEENRKQNEFIELRKAESKEKNINNLNTNNEKMEKNENEEKNNIIQNECNDNELSKFSPTKLEIKINEDDTINVDNNFTNCLDGSLSFLEKKRDIVKNNQVNEFLSPRAKREWEKIDKDMQKVPVSDNKKITKFQIYPSNNFKFEFNKKINKILEEFYQ